MKYIVIFSICGIIMEIYHLFFQEGFCYLSRKSTEINRLCTTIKELRLYIEVTNLMLDKESESENPHIRNVISSFREKFYFVKEGGFEIERWLVTDIPSGNLKKYLYDNTFTRTEQKKLTLGNVVEIGYLACFIGLVRQLWIEGFTTGAVVVGTIMFVFSCVSAWNNYPGKPRSDMLQNIDIFGSVALYIFVLCNYCICFS